MASPRVSPSCIRLLKHWAAQTESIFRRRNEENLAYFISSGKLIAFWRVVSSQMKTTQRKKTKHKTQHTHKKKQNSAALRWEFRQQ